MADGHLADVLDDEAVRRVRAILAERPDAIVSLLDGDGHMLWLSEPGSKGMFGRSPDTIEGQTALDYIHPDDHERTRHSYARALVGETVQYTVRALDVHARWQRVTTIAWGVKADVMVAITIATEDVDPPGTLYR